MAPLEANKQPAGQAFACGGQLMGSVQALAVSKSKLPFSTVQTRIVRRTAGALGQYLDEFELLI